MKIVSYIPALREPFTKLLVEYFVHDLESDIPEEIIRGKLMDLITDQTSGGIIDVVIALEQNTPIGFSIFQIDSAESDWCKRPGWGFIREFYISKEHRRKGYGHILAAYTEQQLRHMGAEQLYLTSDHAFGFWQKCGWSRTNALCTNDLEILVK